MMLDARQAQARENQRTGGAILDVAKVKRIKTALRDGVSPRNIADAMGVGTETIRRISRGESWKWVKEDTPDVAVNPLLMMAPKAGENPELDRAARESAERMAARLAAGEFGEAEARLVEEIGKARERAGAGDKMLGELIEGEGGDDYAG